MRFTTIIVRRCVVVSHLALVLTLGLAVGSLQVSAFAQSTQTAESVSVAVGPQYDTTHVYVAPEDFDRFVASLIATFGGTTTRQGVFTVTPTQSSTMSQLVLTPVGTVSVFGFKTPIPYPFGLERTGYLVGDMDAAVRAAKANGADVIVAAFRALDCAGLARVDFLMEPTPKGKSAKKPAIFLNEINTMPGFTSISMYPKLCAATGIPYKKLIDRLITLAVERHKEKQQTTFTRV